MQDFESLAHVRWECKYHVVFIPKYRRKVLFGKLHGAVGRILRELCDQKGVALLEGHAAVDHVHLFLSIPPKCSVAYTVGFLKGKSAVRIHRELLRERRLTGLHFWATGKHAGTRRDNGAEIHPLVGRLGTATGRVVRVNETHNPSPSGAFPSTSGLKGRSCSLQIAALVVRAERDQGTAQFFGGGVGW